MEQSSTMDKKLQSRLTPFQNKNQDNLKSGYDVAKRSGSQYPKKREYEKFEGSKKSSNRGGRAGQRYVRPREKMGGQVDPKGSESEFGSLQRSGGKKQSIAHLLNWWGPGPERHSHHGWTGAYGSSHGYQKRKQNFHRPKYNKEHYLQANCQFVVSAGPDYSLYDADPDHLVDWEFIEEVRLHASESPSCPICLYPPVAAKVTLCGHIFCYPCILHYLSLTDEKWCKCPICFDAVSKEDLKSVVTILHKEFSTNEEILLILMCRDSSSLTPTPVGSSPLDKKVMTSLSSPATLLAYSKLIVASRAEVSRFVLAREMEALTCLLALEGEEPEACFIQEALNLVLQRDASLNANNLHESTNSSNIENCVTLEDEIPIQQLSLNEGQDRSVNYETISGSQDASLQNRISGGHSSNISSENSVSGLPSPTGQNIGCKEVPNAVHYFYQESSGAHVYLHWLSLQMLTKEYGLLENCPRVINARVLEKESFSMTEERRHRLRYLRHLPITCPFDMVEILMKPPLISELTIAEFEGQLEQREKKRKRRARDEHRIERRVKVNEDRLMGRSRGASINMTSLRHFPSFAEDAAVPLPSLCEEGYSSTPSFTDDLPDVSSTPSFAQMIRCGQKKQVRSVTGDFPSLGATSVHQLTPTMKAQGPASWRHPDTDDQDDDDEEGTRVPDFSTAFSDAFDKAFDQATKKMSESSADNCPGDSRSQGKKGKKKKIVLLSSGGR